MKKSIYGIFLLLGLSFVLHAESYKFEMKTDAKDGVYKVGDEITFTSDLLIDGKRAPGRKYNYILRTDGNKVRSGTVVIGDKPFTLKVKAEFPGWISLNFMVLDDNGRPFRTKSKQLVRDGIGAICGVEKINAITPEPADFDAFWENCKKEVAAVPLKADIQKKWQKSVVTSKGRYNYDWYTFSVPCAGGKPVKGYIAMPLNAKPKSLPIIIEFHGAGVRSSNIILIGRQSARGAIGIDVNAHGIENGQPAKYYSDLNRNELKNYPWKGIESRDTYYFKGMYQRVIRTLEFAKSLPEWDGKNLIIYGLSQGGAQALVAAAMDKDVTLCVVDAPAMSDHFTTLANPARKKMWPDAIPHFKGKPELEKVKATLPYFDNVNFAKRIKCEIYFGIGLNDATCPPTGVYAVYNNLPEKTKKHIYPEPTGYHGFQTPVGQQRLNEACSGK